MPRKRQQGDPRQSYPNRSDLARADRQQPQRVPKGMPYGQGQQLSELQRAAPLPGPGEATVGQISPGPASAPPQSPEEAAKAFRFPGELGIAAPTRRPTEPLTAGLPIGPGPGPESLGRDGGLFVASTLERLARATNDASMKQLADRARAQGV